MKIAVISDLHISTRWVGNISILYQSILLANRLVNYCKNHEITGLIVAGDIVDKAIDRPEVFYTVREVFKIFSSYFEFTYYILGQHDLAINPTEGSNKRDSIVHLLADLPNVSYMNGKSCIIDGLVFGFADFSRNSEYKFDFFCDYYITHFTISNRFGQKIDGSKFENMIAGDIHHRVDIGKLHSIGSFQQQSPSRDSELNNVVVIDTKDGGWFRDDIGGGIKIRLSDTLSGLHDGVFYRLKRKVAQSESPIVNKFQDDNYSTIVTKVSEYLKDKGLELIDNEVKSRLSDRNSFSTDFQLNFIHIHNYIKIRDVELNFNDGDKVLLSGRNGSGKSTFLNALFHGLTGNITWNNVIGQFDSEVFVEIGLTYGENNYRLRRGSGYQYLKIGEIEVTYKNRNEFNSVVSSHLPFIQDLGILFQRPEVGTFFEGINSDKKLNLVSKVYHLEYLDQLYDTGNILYNEYNSKLCEVRKSIDINSALRDEYSKSIQDNLFSGELLDIDKIKSEFIKLSDLKIKYENYLIVKNRIDKINIELSTYSKLLNESKDSLSNLDASEYEGNKSIFIKLTNDLNKYNKLNIELTQLKNKIKELQGERYYILNSKCPRCGQVLNSEYAKSEDKKLESELSNFDAKASEVTSEISKIDCDNFDLLDYYKDKVAAYESNKFKYESNISEYSSKINKLTEELNGINQDEECYFGESDRVRLNELSNLISEYNRYLEIKSKLDNLTKEFNSLRLDEDILSKNLSELNEYLWYVCKTGPIYKLILESLCESWSNDKVRFNIYEGLWRKKVYLDIKIEYLKGDEWQDYSKSSSGEKSYMDILFIKAVTANAGFLILDEFLRHMDTEMTNASIDEINSMNVRLFILSSFNENLYFANRYIRAKYDEINDECKIIAGQ